MTENAVEPMLTFDISAIDIVLLVAVLVLILLFVTQHGNKAVVESRSTSSSLDETSEKLEAGIRSKDRERDMKQSPLGFTKCIHDFGYLRNLPQNTPVPDECFGCPMVMRCLFPNAQAPQVE